VRLLGVRHVPEHLCGGRVYLGRYNKCSTFFLIQQQWQQQKLLLQQQQQPSCVESAVSSSVNLALEQSMATSILRITNKKFIKSRETYDSISLLTLLTQLQLLASILHAGRVQGPKCLGTKVTTHP